jgi:hypothetical protein
MHVTFDNKADYFADLQRAVQASAEPDGVRPVVRTMLDVRHKSETCTIYTVISGFHDARYSYEATISCGRDDVSGRGGKTPALDAANSLIGEIREVCRQLEIEHLGGRWTRP